MGLSCIFKKYEHLYTDRALYSQHHGHGLDPQETQIPILRMYNEMVSHETSSKCIKKNFSTFCDVY